MISDLTYRSIACKAHLAVHKIENATYINSLPLSVCKLFHDWFTTVLLVFLFAMLRVALPKQRNYCTALSSNSYLGKKLVIYHSTQLKPSRCLFWLIKPSVMKCRHLQFRFSMDPVKHCNNQNAKSKSEQQ